MAAYQYIYVMKGLTKIYPGGRKVLEDIWLCFLPGAKIGVLGLNGAGKSTLLRIMAGPRQRFRRRGLGGGGRQRRLSCRRSRSSTPRRTCWATSWKAWREKKALLDRFDAVSAQAGRGRLARRDGQADRRAGRAAGKDRRRQTAGSLTHGRNRDGRAALPAGRRRGRQVFPAASGAASRSAACCCNEPDMLLLDEPTNHLDAESVAWLERHLQQIYTGTVIAVTHDRYFLDNVAGWILELDRGHGIPWEGQLLVLAGAEAEAPASRRRSPRATGRKTLERELEWIRSRPRRGRPRARRASTAYEQLARAGDRAATARPGGDLHPARPAAGRRGHRSREHLARLTAIAC